MNKIDKLDYFCYYVIVPDNDNGNLSFPFTNGNQTSNTRYADHAIQ
jgi:hypothetical protein